ncbi:trehalose synthase [Kockovaella imperatae]|uniref:Trehalose synthase n=1 Tax=Kockovaella imperatae TaxID=4999 RepID=A0A1Y1US75_9TREE|nr:trehalose synthase [Kockovaella imperatae]ORX40487.1 trehalose synthase [Kockovaella imperatae]
MAPQRQLSTGSCRKPSRQQDVFLGIALQIGEQPKTAASESGDKSRRDLEYTIVLHDGTGVIGSETFHYVWHTHGLDDEARKDQAKSFAGEVLATMREIQTTRSMKICLIAVAQPVPEEIKSSGRGTHFLPTVWLHVDAIPFTILPSTAIFTKLPSPSTQAGATAAVSAAVKYLHAATHTATTATLDNNDHHVQVDCDGQVTLCDLIHYEESTSPQLWSRFMALAKLIRGTNTSIHFFSATPQGGGVALMRHALVRLWKLVGVQVKWFVPEGHPTVFDITKRKMHNVLQGVAPQGTEMTDEDKQCFELWTEQNYESFWSRGAIDASVIVIDDPQLTALIPIIKKRRPDAKIIFRSHIQIQSNLTDDPSTPQYRTWNYLFNFVKQTDLFLAHPVKFFIPKNVHENLPVLYMPPSTDPLDGLNKLYGHHSVTYYREYFNHLASSQGDVAIDWARGYICQIARFDPSKGIDVLLEAYLKFRQKLEKSSFPPEDGGPQLIIMGHGSVDDPDGTMIYEMCHDILSKEEYQLVNGDVAVVRAPPSDSLLGCILQGAWVATQLSTREGFEVKVTEAINKRVPIIASDAGGIPVQVKQSLNGWVVPAGRSEPVATLLYDIYTGKAKVKRPVPKGRDTQGETDPNAVAEAYVGGYEQPVPPVRADIGSTSEDYWTVGNAAKWMLLFSKILQLQVPEGLGGTDADLLNGMRASERIGGKEVDATAVWQMVMGTDMLKGEGEIR